jgi:Pyruvate flavodoxin/ferredoxin oxidoreductase, thiamine diP-bdg
MTSQTAVMDGNTAAAHIAYLVNEVCAIYPITPSSTLAELADAYAGEVIKNLWRDARMQSSNGPAGPRRSDRVGRAAVAMEIAAPRTWRRQVPSPQNLWEMVEVGYLGRNVRGVYQYRRGVYQLNDRS